MASQSLQGHYAGAVSRFAAFAADAGVSTCLFLAGLAATTFALSIITGHTVTIKKASPALGLIFLGWLFTYYAYSWGAFGRTVGMALLGVRVV
ncbi:MAG TPA: RDD family protein, partial [Streptosporangiaceae bacterium]